MHSARRVRLRPRDFAWLGVVAVLFGFGLVAKRGGPEPTDHYARRIERTTQRMRRASGFEPSTPANTAPHAEDRALATTDPEDAGLEDAARPAWLADLVSRFCPPLVGAVCAERAACGCGGGDCVVAQHEACERWLDSQYGYYADYTEEDGVRVTISETVLARCIGTMTGALGGCRTIHLSDPCMNMVSEECTDCEDEAYDSEPYEDEDDYVEASLGEACDEDVACSDGLECSEGRCVTSCYEDMQCARFEVCVDERCVRMRRSGESCVETAECAPAHVCEAGRCAAQHVCRYDRDCGVSASCTGESTPRCVAQPVGGTCGSDYDCAFYEVCTDGSCTPGPRIGARCARTRCGAGATCRGGDTPTCVAAPAAREGDACSAYTPGACGRDLICNHERICAPGLAAGEDCAGRSFACVPGTTCLETYPSGRCVSEMCAEDTAFVYDGD